MAFLPVWKVHYGFEANGKLVTETYIDYVQAATNDYNSLKAGLVTNNGRQKGPGTLTIYAVQNVGASGIA